MADTPVTAREFFKCVCELAEQAGDRDAAMELIGFAYAAADCMCEKNFSILPLPLAA